MSTLWNAALFHDGVLSPWFLTGLVILLLLRPLTESLVEVGVRLMRTLRFTDSHPVKASQNQAGYYSDLSSLYPSVSSLLFQCRSAVGLEPLLAVRVRGGLDSGQVSSPVCFLFCLDLSHLKPSISLQYHCFVPMVYNFHSAAVAVIHGLRLLV